MVLLPMKLLLPSNLPKSFNLYSREEVEIRNISYIKPKTKRNGCGLSRQVLVRRVLKAREKSPGGEAWAVSVTPASLAGQAPASCREADSRVRFRSQARARGE